VGAECVTSGCAGVSCRALFGRPLGLLLWREWPGSVLWLYRARGLGRASGTTGDER